jgi:hypothetical protein
MNLITNWIERHRNRTNFWLHMAGIPGCYVVAPVLLILRLWWWALAAFVLGYVLQFVGHHIEGNSSGEEMLFKWLAREKKGSDHGQGTDTRQG